MSKYFVTITNNCLNYRLSKEDIRQVHSLAKHMLPALPAYANTATATKMEAESYLETGKQAMATQDMEMDSYLGADNQ
jgi:hypothetical protein